MKIVLASHNPGKLLEFRTLMADFDIVPQANFKLSEIEETGKTFIENAILKARHACAHSHLPALADDSGLLVEALAGAPGIYSARYAGTPSNAANNIKKLLADLIHVPPNQRHAFFYCIIVFLIHAEDPAPIICEGRWHGTILTAPRGKNGFGYDPIFFSSRENKSAAELNLAEKNQAGHRGQALKLLVEKLYASAFHKKP